MCRTGHEVDHFNVKKRWHVCKPLGWRDEAIQQKSQLSVLFGKEKKIHVCLITAC